MRIPAVNIAVSPSRRGSFSSTFINTRRHIIASKVDKTRTACTTAHRCSDDKYQHVALETVPSCGHREATDTAERRNGRGVVSGHLHVGDRVRGVGGARVVRVRRRSSFDTERGRVEEIAGQRRSMDVG